MPPPEFGATMGSMRTMAGVVEEGTLMTSADAMRASDEDREKVVSALQEQVGLGRLTLPEFEERSTAAYAATTIGDLRKLTADLPIEVFPRPEPASPWAGNLSLPPTPPWANRRPRGGRLPERRRGVSPMIIVAGIFFVLIVLNAVSAAVGLAAHFFFPLLPIFFVLMVILRMGPGRFRR
jgi:hypothetical protein